MPTCWLDGGDSSIGVPSSQEILICVNLTKTTQLSQFNKDLPDGE